MHHSVGVCAGEGVDDFDQQPHRLVNGQLAFAREPLAERLAFHVRHDEEQSSSRLTGIEQRQDVRMLQLGGDLDLAEESRSADRRGEILAQHLERDVAFVLHVAREVYGGHAAVAQLAVYCVAVGESLNEKETLGGHCTFRSLTADVMEAGPIRGSA